MLYRQMVQVLVRLQLIRCTDMDTRKHGDECDPLFGCCAPPLYLPPDEWRRCKMDALNGLWGTMLHK